MATISSFALILSCVLHIVAVWGVPNLLLSSTPKKPATQSIVTVSFLTPPTPSTSPIPSASIAQPKKSKVLNPKPKITPKKVTPINKGINIAKPKKNKKKVTPKADIPQPQPDTPPDIEEEKTPKQASNKIEPSPSQVPQSPNLPFLPPSVSPIALSYSINWNNISGVATYTLTHEDGRYNINFQAEGSNALTRLLSGGETVLQTEGRIENDGLHPERFFKEHGTQEEVIFDPTSPRVRLSNGNSVALPDNVRALDPLSLILQFYFNPPTSNSRECLMVELENVKPCRLERESTESLNINGLNIDTEVWVQYDSKDKAERKLWLAPYYYYMPVQIHDFTHSIELKLERINSAQITQ